jgi:hypothetical protein
MIGEVFIVLWGDLSYFLEIPPWASGEVVMLNVIA